MLVDTDGDPIDMERLGGGLEVRELKEKVLHIYPFLLIIINFYYSVTRSSYRPSWSPSRI